MIDLAMHIAFLRELVDPDITVDLDDHVLWSGPQRLDSITVRFSGILPPGHHRLRLRYHNMHKVNEQDQDMAVIIQRIDFQSLDHDFKVYSRYVPNYPDIWLQQQIASGRQPDREIHSNYLGWNGTWYLDFETPIYQWAHQRRNLGWLI